MTLGLDILISFVSSTALALNLGSFILPNDYRRAFSTIINLHIPEEVGRTLDITFHGKCYLGGISAPCGGALMTVYRSSTRTGYESPEDENAVLSILNLMKPANASYTICKSHPCSHKARRGSRG
jgi:hypothetical protein